MWAYRRYLLAAAVFFALIYFLTSSQTTSPVPKPVSAQTRIASDTSAPSRSYPPPRTPSQKKAHSVQVPENLAVLPLRDRLRYHFPYDLESKFPAMIWQTWKTSPATGDFDARLRLFEASWTELHPNFVHEVVTDAAALHLIEYLYASFPDVVEAYVALPKPVMKADFFRYLILLARGGIYTDIDTTALKSTADWLPKDFDRRQIGLVIGIEADPDREDWADWYSRRIQFCQWTIQSKPGHPVLREVVARITEDTLRMKKDQVLKAGTLPKSIVEFTGPAVWTDAVFAYFNSDFFDFSQRQTNITYSDFFGITEHKKVGDVIVLPITSFSPGVQQMGAKEPDDEMAFVQHEFEGSWKPAGEKMGNPYG